VEEDKQTLVIELYERCRGTLEKLASAIFQRLRPAAGDGQGAFFLAMLCFGAAAFLFHRSLQPQALLTGEHQDDDSEYSRRDHGRHQGLDGC